VINPFGNCGKDLRMFRQYAAKLCRKLWIWRRFGKILTNTGTFLPYLTESCRKCAVIDKKNLLGSL
jgi:hypothetical protein